MAGFISAMTAPLQETCASPTIDCGSNHAPKVTVKNGTYIGVHSVEYDQDFFLGIPFAQPPVGQLRFRNPLPLNDSWGGARKAVEWSPSCVGYGADPVTFSEDCLYLNVIRPSRHQDKKLPVAVYIHGGGFTGGQGTSQRYNMSFTVQHSVEMGTPVIGITINYRLSVWGFMQSKEVASSGESNWGLRDQRLALHWIRENVAAFGGDPDKVTIWGESAGAYSVGFHLIAYNGRDDGLFRSAIMESGTPVSTSRPVSYFQPTYDKLAGLVGCNSSVNSLECLRNTPYGQLNAVVNSTAMGFGGTWFPTIDGDFIAGYNSEALSSGKFVHVPILIGCNSEEGTAFYTRGLNTSDEFKASLVASGMSDSQASQIMDAYPLNNTEAVLQNLPQDWVPPATAQYGLQYRRAATYAGDQTFIANRRLVCETYAKAGLETYCFRFNAVPAGTPALQGATHYAEIGFVFYNLLGVGYPPVKVPPFEGIGQEYSDLASLMNGDWISFIANGNPNMWKGRQNQAPTLGVPIPKFPAYYGHDGVPRNYLYNANVSSSVEKDTWRAEGMRLINDLNRDVFLR
ncbi:alpha/beta-hydrolase [Thozetella sp. PMI_491]|nr:alpha/beta-hydrolase [Thozetella sp. PMI_491]